MRPMAVSDTQPKISANSVQQQDKQPQDEAIRLLLVEDNPDDASLLKDALGKVRHTRFEIAHAERLDQAVEQLSQAKFDAILLDLALPDSSGLDTLAAVREHAPDVPVVVLSVLTDEEIATEMVRQGAQDYLVKGQVGSDLLARSIRYA